MVKKVFKVNGMKCNNCKAKVEEALRGVNGVASAEVSLENACANVEWDETQTHPADLKAAVDALGRFELVLD